ncbi:hypothetical protein CWI36_0617p0020 [Hamiltosporidium magnivora]|uniref:Uncharacterized protein n=1 Tax=Hamiltosporidium magnivora TaxID=148818 RepID=A0A4Q9LDG8_9MICR|nr:hypothetical protein CWI36_0617p0020 [Hamiltosporidium magnivora]
MKYTKYSMRCKLPDKDKNIKGNRARINKEKSTTNDACCEDTAILLEGIMKDSRSNPTRSSFNEVQSKLISRVERLCHTRLNAKNLLSAINQHAISLINYHVGVVRLELANFSKLDDAVRAVLININEESDLEEEETVVIKEGRKIKSQREILTQNA